MEALEALRLTLERAAGEDRRLVHRLRRLLGGAGTRQGIPGLYLWGSVGRGKTFLMNLFHASLRVPSRRTHFHHFMHDVHAGLHRHRERPDPLAHVAAGIADGVRVLCFDELYVSDIADAMILGGLFEHLVGAGTTLVFTSNAPPAELYRDGLQRQRFLPAIALLEAHTRVLCVDGGTDYRLRELERAPLYVESGPGAGDDLLAERFEALAGQPGEAGGNIEVDSRPIPLRRHAAGIAWFHFRDLCEGPRSQSDYIELARILHTVVLSDVPRFDPASEDAARRFIALVDEFYDRGVKLVVSAATSPAGLYQGERLAFEFERTASRLVEMQTHAYLERPHRP